MLAVGVGNGLEVADVDSDDDAGADDEDGDEDAGVVEPPRRPPRLEMADMVAIDVVGPPKGGIFGGRRGGEGASLGSELSETGRSSSGGR